MPCGSVEFPSATKRHARFRAFAVRARASHCYEWFDLQMGWNRLELELQPGRLTAAAGHEDDEEELQPTEQLKAAVRAVADAEAAAAAAAAAVERLTGPSTSSEIRRQIAEEMYYDAEDMTREEGEALRAVVDVALGFAEDEADTQRDERLARQLQGEEERAAGATLYKQVDTSAAAAAASSPPTAPPSAGTRRAAQRAQARKLGGFLAARNWELLYRCVQTLMLECAEQVAASVASGAGAGAAAAPSSSSSSSAAAGADEALVLRLLAGWRAYKEWLELLCGVFAHHGGTACCAHLVCCIQHHRHRELATQNTASLIDAGHAAFRGAAVLGAGCAAAVRRHVERAGASVLAHGGYSPESSVLMQQLIDLHRMVAEIDVRDDHLCVEAGMRFTQEDLRASLISPIADIWEQHGRSWVCGRRIAPEDYALYAGERRGRKSKLIQVGGRD